MALSVEVSELMENFQWLTEEQSSVLPPEKLQLVREEIGDVLIYLTRLADKLRIDPMESAFEKLEVNRAKYPAEKVWGSAKKYTEL
jgi:NTP pyrophosphatase (non-canonical NTP hydrolase)